MYHVSLYTIKILKYNIENDQTTYLGILPTQRQITQPILIESCKITTCAGVHKIETQT